MVEEGSMNTTVDTAAMRTRANWLHPEIRQDILGLCDALDEARKEPAWWRGQAFEEERYKDRYRDAGKRMETERDGALAFIGQVEALLEEDPPLIANLLHRLFEKRNPGGDQ